MTPHTFPLNACVLLIVEGSAACEHWPSHLGAPPESGWGVLEQEEWEPLSDFLARLDGVMPRFAASDASPVVVLVASHFWDASAHEARRKLALDVLAALAQAGGGTLLLSHGHQHDGLCREALTALARELSPEWSDSRVVVGTRFEERARRPETRRPSSPTLKAAGQIATT